MRDHFLLGEVGKVLGRKPHQIVHLLTTGKIPEPQTRIANKRYSFPKTSKGWPAISGSPRIGLPSKRHLRMLKLRQPER